MQLYRHDTIAPYRLHGVGSQLQREMVQLKRKKTNIRKKKYLRNRMTTAEATARSTFDQVFSPLTIRARNVLYKAGVRDVASFLSFTYDELIRRRNCGKKTAAEVTVFQLKLLSDPPLETAVNIPVPISFDDVPAEVFDAILGKLCVRAVHTLNDLNVHSVKAFMELDESQLLARQSCGKKTAGIIMGLQGALRQFARTQVQNDGGYRPEYLLNAPCLTGNVEELPNVTPPEGFSLDLENPAPWLMLWVKSLAKTERHARVFMLRMGMLGEEPITLAAVAKRFGSLTRERIRQIQKSVAKKAEASFQQNRLRPLVDAAAIIVTQKGGWVRLEELTETVLCKGKDGEQLKQATGLMAFFSKLQVWKDAGLREAQDGIVCNLSKQGEVPRRNNVKRCSKVRLKLRYPPPPVNEAQLSFDFDDLKI